MASSLSATLAGVLLAGSLRVTVRGPRDALDLYVAFREQPSTQVADTRMSPLRDMCPKNLNGLEDGAMSRTALTAVATVPWSLVNS